MTRKTLAIPLAIAAFTLAFQLPAGATVASEDDKTGDPTGGISSEPGIEMGSQIGTAYFKAVHAVT